MSSSDIKDSFVRLHIAVLIAGGTGLFGRLVSVGELPLVSVRVALAAIILTVVLAAQHKLHRVPSAHMWKMMGCGVLLAVHWVLFYGSIKASNVSIGAVCVSLIGFFTAILEPLFGHSKPKWREILLSLVTVLGISLIFGLDPRYRLGIGIGFVSSFVCTLFSISSKRVQASTGESSSTMLLYELFGGTVILLAAVSVYPSLFPDAQIIPSPKDWVYLLLLASVFTIVPFILQLQVLRRISAFTVNLTYNLEPVYTIFFAMILFGEATELTFSFWIGIALIVLSVALQAVYSSRRQS